MANGTSFSFRVMVQSVGAVVSEGPMPQFNATLGNLPLSPDVTATETACMLMTYCLTISMHVAFSVFFAVVFGMPILGKSI